MAKFIQQQRLCLSRYSDKQSEDMYNLKCSSSCPDNLFFYYNGKRVSVKAYPGNPVTMFLTPSQAALLGRPSGTNMMASAEDAGAWVLENVPRSDDRDRILDKMAFLDVNLRHRLVELGISDVSSLSRVEKERISRACSGEDLVGEYEPTL